MKETGDSYFDSADFQRLLNSYEQSVNAGEPVFMDAEELVDIADYYQYTGRKDEAEQAIELAMSLSPGSIAPLTYRLHEALYQGNTRRAWDILDQIIDKDEPDYIYNRAEILIVEGKIDEADDYLRKQLTDMSADEYQDYVIDVANIFSDYNQPEKAMEWMSRAKQEDTPDFKELMARTLFGIGKFKDSERLFSELVDTDPFSKKYWNALASAQFMNEDFSNAIQSSEYAIAIDPNDPDGLLSKANGLFRLNNYEEALKYYERYSKQMPDDECAYLYQGTCLINMGQQDEALPLLQKAAEIAPPDSEYICDIYQELALAYSEQGETDKAIDLLNQIDQSECDQIQLGIIRGHVLLTAGRLEEAEQAYHQAVNASDTPKQTLLRVIISFYDNGYLEGAYQLLLRFLSYFSDEKPENTEGYAFMALCCHDLKRYDEFLKYLKKSCEVNPNECRLALSHLFPDELQPQDYYEYIKEKIMQ